jgi:hypothetical protein
LCHLEEIRRFRRSRWTWRDIAEHLTNKHGIQITAAGVHIFFKRATRRKRAPLGFEDPRVSQPAAGNSLEPGCNITPGEQPGPDNEGISVMPISKPKKHPIFSSWTPEQGINYTPKN